MTKITVSLINGNKLVNMDTGLFEHIVYKNFYHLAGPKELNHNMNEVHRLCNSSRSFVLTATIEGALVGYVLGEIINLNGFNQMDNRSVCYITYLYTVPKFRNTGIATQMLKLVRSFFKKSKSDGIMLTFDTTNQKLARFYKKNGFMRDLSMATGNRWDVYYRRYY